MSRAVLQNARPAICPKSIISSFCIYSLSFALSSRTSL